MVKSKYGISVQDLQCANARLSTAGLDIYKLYIVHTHTYSKTFAYRF